MSVQLVAGDESPLDVALYRLLIYGLLGAFSFNKINGYLYLVLVQLFKIC